MTAAELTAKLANEQQEFNGFGSESKLLMIYVRQGEILTALWTIKNSSLPTPTTPDPTTR